MKELIKVIAFDADDTLWSNEPFFQDIEKQYTDLLKSYGTPEDISAALFQTEMNNLKCLGYGAKAFPFLWSRRLCELVDERFQPQISNILLS